MNMGRSVKIWKFTGNPADLIEPVCLQPEPQTLDEATRLLPSGGYTTLRTYGKFQTLNLERHFERLEETTRLAGSPEVMDRKMIRQGLGKAIASFPYNESRVRIIVDLEDLAGTIYLLLEKLNVPDESSYRNGVRVITRTMHRENPKAKLTRFIEEASNARAGLPAGINEVVMVSDEGQFLEGLSSNFFGVIQGEIWTAGAGVLSGITRSLVLEAARDANIPVRLEPVSLADQPRLDEAFLTSASRSVLPVVEINGRPVGSGKPGTVTRRLMNAYWQRVEKELENVQS